MARLLQHIIVLSYLAVTGSALVYTLTRVKIPLVPWVLVHRSYRMMAPYQGDEAWNADLLAEGLRDNDVWESVDVDTYLPYGFGERNVRKFFKEEVPLGADAYRRIYARFAALLLRHERERGRAYRAIRLTMEEWPRSPAGFDFLRHEPFFLRRTVLTEVR